MLGELDQPLESVLVPNLSSISVALGTDASCVSLLDQPQLQRVFPRRELYLCLLSSQTQLSIGCLTENFVFILKQRNVFKNLFHFCLRRAKEVYTRSVGQECSAVGGHMHAI